jgi:hypothetical protein
MKRGDRIPGSRWYRDWCAGCREPIRVSEPALDLERNYCRDCAPVKSEPKRHGRDGAEADREFHGGRFSGGEW